MKKKFIAVYALIGVLALGSTTLTSCVDDNESASVTAVRDAKAAQLNSIAALNNAQAAAQELRAQAEADLAAANAAYQQALADQEASKAEFLAQKYQAEIEKIKAEYEADIMAAKENASLAEQQLWNNLQGQFNNLYRNYTTALGQVQDLNEQLFQKQYELANAEINHDAAEAIAQKQIYNYNLQIATKTAQIERLQTQVGDKDALLKQMNDLAAQAYKLNKTDLPAAEEAENVAEEAFDEAFAPINVGRSITDQHEQLEWEASALDYVFAVDTLQMIERNYGAGFNNSLIEMVSEEVEPVEGCYETGSVNTWVPTEGSEYMRATNDALTYLNNQIEIAQNAIGKNTDAADQYGTAYARVKYYTDAKTAADAAAKADPDNDVLAQAATDAAIALQEANEYMEARTAELAEAQQWLTSYNNAIAAVTEGSEEQKAYADAVAKAIEAKEAQMTAAHATHLVKDAIEIIGLDDTNFDTNGEVIGSWTTDSEYGLAYSLYNGTTTAEQAILELKQQIAQIQEDITTVYSNTGHYETVYGAYLYTDTDSDGVLDTWVWQSGEFQVWVADPEAQLTVEQAQQLIQLEIDQINAELEAQEAVAAQYKAALEAAIQNMTVEDVEIPTVPETPAEEETPAEGEEAPAE